MGGGKMVNLLLFGLLNPIVIAIVLIVLASLKVVKEYE